MELQRGFAKLEQNQRMELKKAAPEGLLRKPQDRALAEQPRMMYDGKAGARAALPPMAPGMPRNFDFRQNMAKRAGAKPNPWPPMPVRVFAHPRAAGPAEIRYDFAETLFWHPVLVLPGGKTEVSFDLCDSLSAFEVTAFAHTLDGRLGAATQSLTVAAAVHGAAAHAAGSDRRRQDRHSARHRQQHRRSPHGPRCCHGSRQPVTAQGRGLR